MIYQELTLAPHLTVEQNIVLGREPRRFGLVDRTGHARARRSGRWPGWTSRSWIRRASSRRSVPGARQLVEVARALAGDARVVVMDEPTSSLSKPESERLFAVIERLRARGVAVIYISHFSRRSGASPSATRCCATAAASSVATSLATRMTDVHPRIIEAMAGRSLAEPRIRRCRTNRARPCWSSRTSRDAAADARAG